MSEGKTTTNHDEIRRWAERRGGVPSSVKGTERNKGKADHAGILRLDFEPRDEGLEEISWDEFFEKFDKEKLAFLYQDETSGGETSRFHKFINRSTAAKSTRSSAAKSPATRSAAAKSSGTKTSATKSTGTKSTGAKSTGTKSAGAKTTATKSTGTRSTGSKSAGTKSASSKTSTRKKS